MPKRIALIDADSVLYATALGAEMRIGGSDPDAEGTYIRTKSLNTCYQEVVDKLDALVGDVDAEDAIVALTTTRCFRYDLLATYKANREFTHRPEVLGELQAMVQEKRPFGVLAVRGLEADDVVAISSGALQESSRVREPVVISPDKDLLSVPGLVYSPLNASAGIVEVTPEEADTAHLYQTLVGDAVDNYKGCPGIGKVKARKVLERCAHEDTAGKWKWVVEQFRLKGVPLKDALVQARVARIVRHDEWDQAKGIVRLWGPGQIVPDILQL